MMSTMFPAFAEKYSGLQLRRLRTELPDTAAGASVAAAVLDIRIRRLRSHDDDYLLMRHLPFSPVDHVFQPEEAYR